MKKYVLLGIPLILFSLNLFPYFNFQYDESLTFLLQIVLNMIIVLLFLVILLKRTSLQSVFDWMIGVCFSVYLCFLYMKTLEISLFHSHITSRSEEIQRMLTFSVNLIPFKGMIDTLRNNPAALYQIFGNGIMLTPLAFTMLYFKWVKSIKQAVWYSFLCTLGIECIQFMQTCVLFLFGFGEGRSTDVDDVILNTIGAVVGAACYLLWWKIENHFIKKTKKDVAI